MTDLEKLIEFLSKPEVLELATKNAYLHRYMSLPPDIQHTWPEWDGLSEDAKLFWRRLVVKEIKQLPSNINV